MRSDSPRTALAVLLIGSAAHANTAASGEPPIAEAATPTWSLLGSIQDEGEDRVYWKDGLRYESADGDFGIQIGGRLQADWGWFTGDEVAEAFATADDPDPLADGTEFRRARLFIAGVLYGNMGFKAEYDFAGSGDTTLKDLYLEFQDVWGKPRVGHIKEPFGLEELTSSKYITFMERASPTEAFAPSRGSGVRIGAPFLEDDRATWSAGIFRDTDDFAEDTGDGDYVGTGRVTWLPVYADEGRSLVHLGAAYSLRSANDEAVRFRARPEAHLLPRFVDTGTFAAEGTSLAGLEGAWVRGPFSLQGELYQAMVDSEAADDPDFSGYYVQGSWFLTGEHRPYKGGAFGRVKPASNFQRGEGGSGAWEIGARYSSIDLTDEGIAGGEQDDVTVGLNWYMNPNVRIAANYVMTDIEPLDESADLFMLRFQIDF